MSRRSIIIILSLIIVYSCSSPSKLNEKELITYMNDPSNGLVKTNQLTKNSPKVSVYYQPSSLFLSQELEAVDSISLPVVQKIQQKYNTYSYFKLVIDAREKELLYQGTNNYGIFSNNLKKVAFKMPEYVYTTNSHQDTIPVFDYVYPRYFGHSRETEFLFSFEREKIEKGEWIRFHLKDLGLGLGSNLFEFSIKDIKNIPSLDFTLAPDNHNN